MNSYFFFASIGVYVYTGVTLFCTFWYKYRIHYIEVEKNLIEANAAKAKIPVKMDGLTPELNFEEEFKGVRVREGRIPKDVLLPLQRAHDKFKSEVGTAACHTNKIDSMKAFARLVLPLLVEEGV